MTLNRCESASCCTHELTVGVVMRDGVPHGLCLECGSDVPVPAIPEVVSVPNLGTPCGEDIKPIHDSRIWNEWGGPL